MKKGFYISFIAVFFVVCALPAVLMPVLSASTSAEKRTLSDPPQLFKDGAVNSEFGTEAETWLSEHFAGRSQLVTLHARLEQALFATSAESQVILGREGWLFYEPTLDDYLGVEPYSARELYALAAVERLMQQYVEANGGRYAATVAPNKNSIYGEYMPYFTHSARGQSGLAALPAAMQAQGVNYVDLYGLLTAAKGQVQLYHKRDTHWNNYGARLAYNALLEAVDQPHDAFDDAAYTVEKTWEGDLDVLLLPAGGVPDDQMTYNIPFAQLFTYRGSANVELARVLTRGTGSGSLLMYRDSFGNALLPFVATAFQDATFLRANPFDLTRMEPGQTVLTEIVERNLRELLGPAPVMPAPETAIPTPQKPLESSTCTLCTAVDGDWLRVYGALDPALVHDDTRVCVLARAGGDVTAYEAFPCSEELPDGSAPAAGYGYSARLSEADMPPDATLSLALVTGGETIEILCK